MGAKGKYEYWLTEDGLLRLEAYARDGMTDEGIAAKCGINPSTLYDWKRSYPQIDKALKRGKEVVDYEVENALLKRALGYEFTEVTIEETENGPKRKTVFKQMAPDVTAQIFWLKNRKRDTWRDKQPDTQESDNGILDKIIEAVKALE